jgi:hypothetical protein
MNSARGGVPGFVGLLLTFCAFQCLLGYWMAIDPYFVPDISKAEKLIGERQYLMALKHLEPLAGSGSVVAHWMLGQLYVNGDGVSKDVYRGIHHLEMAGDGGSLQAQFLLSRIYSDGEDLPRDLVRAHLWLSLAALQEQSEAPGLLAMLERIMTPAEIEQAWAMAERHVPGTRQKISVK